MTDRPATPDRFRAELRDALLAHAATLREHPLLAAPPRRVSRRGAGSRAGLRRRVAGGALALAALVIAAVLTLGSAGTLRPEPATAAGVLNASATAVDNHGGARTLGPGEFFYSRIAEWWRYAEFSRYPYIVRSVDEQWLGRDGRGRSRYDVLG